MNFMNTQPHKAAGPFTRFLHRIAAYDTETLYRCPPRDWSTASAIGGLMLFVWAYQTALFSMIAHRLFSPDDISPIAIAGGAFLASFILVIDSYMIMRSGHHAAGIQALKRGGIDLSGGMGAQIKAGIFLCVRILLSVGLAQLLALIFSILIFHGDIDAKLHAAYLDANKHLLPAAITSTDAEIQRATEEVKAETAREEALAAQIETLRQNQIDPASTNPAVRDAEQELKRATAAKDQADEAARKAEEFASNELGGIRGSPGNSGQAGVGMRRRAAVEMVKNARERDRQAADAVEAARSRLTKIRQHTVVSVDEIKQEAHAQLPAHEEMLAAEQKKLAAAKQELARLIREREATITNSVAKAPDHVEEDRGFAAQVLALEQIADADPLIYRLVWIIDVTSFGLELAAVLAKVTSWIPSRYNALIASESYKDEVQIADELLKDLEGPKKATLADLFPLHDVALDPAEDKPAPASDGPANPFDSEPSSEDQPKRGRGHPRKPKPE